MDLKQTREFLSSSPDYVNLRTLPGLQIDLRYASTDNFMGADVYGDFTEPFLHRRAAEKLVLAVRALERDQPGFRLRIFDALRPRSVQRVLHRFVAGTPQESYVANPDRGSLHNYGCAIDLTALDADGRELDMGAGFDAFDPLSEPQLEERHLAEGRLGALQLANRLVLRKAMTEGGWHQLPHEWWHYDAFPREQVRAEFPIVE